MSENQNLSNQENNTNINPEAKRPAVTPEQQRAFRSTYAQVSHLANSKGVPHTISSGEHKTTLHLNILKAKAFDENFSHDANGLEATVYSADGTQRPGWVYANGESGAKKSGYLASIAIQKDPEDIDQDIYTLFPEGNIGYERFVYEGGDEDENGQKNDLVVFDHWLNAEEIEGLGILIESAEPGWLPRSLPE